jgi:hypothetical protein
MSMDLDNQDWDDDVEEFTPDMHRVLWAVSMDLLEWRSHKRRVRGWVRGTKQLEIDEIQCFLGDELVGTICQLLEHRGLVERNPQKTAYTLTLKGAALL